MKVDAKMAKAMDKLNQKNLKKVDSGGSIEYKQAGNIVLIGKGHDKVLESDVKDKQTCKGKITVTREMIGKGQVSVSGSKGRREMEDTIKRISKKKVVFE